MLVLVDFLQVDEFVHAVGRNTLGARELIIATQIFISLIVIITNISWREELYCRNLEEGIY